MDFPTRKKQRGTYKTDFSFSVFFFSWPFYFHGRANAKEVASTCQVETKQEQVKQYEALVRHQLPYPSQQFFLLCWYARPRSFEQHHQLKPSLSQLVHSQEENHSHHDLLGWVAIFWWFHLRILMHKTLLQVRIVGNEQDHGDPCCILHIESTSKMMVITET